jgi:eukaryotic-like serine/threonine-protein kinase
MGKASKVIAFLLSIICLISIAFTQASIATGQTSTNASTIDWPMFHHDPARTGATNSSAPMVTPAVLWSFQALSGITSSPAIVDGQLFVTDYTGDFYCLNASTGSQIWVGRATASPTVSEGIVYAGHNLITAFNASNGEKIWSGQTTFGVGGTSPALARGVLYTSLGGDGVYAFNASTGVKIWNYTTGDSYSSPAVAGDCVYLAGGIVRAFNASAGTKLWEHSSDGYVEASLAVSDDLVYVSSDEQFCALNASTGDKAWSVSIRSRSSPTVADGRVFVGSLDFNVYAFNASTGVKLWNYTTGYVVDSSPAVAVGGVFVGSGDGNLYAFDASKGNKLWNFTLQPLLDEKGFSRYLFASPAIVDGIIYTGSSNGKVYALHTALATSEISFIISLYAIIAFILLVIISALLFRGHRKATNPSK